MFGCLQNFLLDVPKALVILLSPALGFKRKKITIAFPVFKRVLTFTESLTITLAAGMRLDCEDWQCSFP